MELCAVTMKAILKKQNPNYQKLLRCEGFKSSPTTTRILSTPQPPVHAWPPCYCQNVAFLCPPMPNLKIRRRDFGGSRRLYSSAGRGGTQQASTPGTVPCPHPGDLRDCTQPGSPGSLSLPPSFRNANSPTRVQGEQKCSTG